jgi:branched-chain amino acid transport system permease protein
VSAGSPYLRRSYEEDAALVATPTGRLWLGVLAVALLGAPLLASPLALDLLCRAAIAVVGAHALNLLTGYTGLVSLGHAGLIAAGAFTSGILVHEAGAPFWIAVPASVAIGAVLGLVVGAPSLRLKGVYLALGTLALHFLIIYLVGEYQSGRGLATGLLIPRPSLGPFRVVNPAAWYYVLVTIAVLATIFSLNLVRTRPGRAWTAIRDRDIAAAATGVNVTAYKLLAFVVSSAMTALAGSLWAHYTGFVSVEAFSFFMTIEYIAMIIIGGVGSILGSILGALFVTVFPYAVDAVIDAVPVPARFHTYLFAVKFGAFGLLMALFLTLEPRGLVSIWSRLRTWFELWPFRYQPLSE